MAKARQKTNAKTSKNKLTEAQIAVHWKEEEYFYPSKKFKAQANLADPSFVKKFSEKNFPKCFDIYAKLLDWDKPWRKTLDTSNPPFWKWFVGGKLNACYNCVDRHLAEHKNKAALIFVPEPESEAATVITYQELYKRVNEVAAMLRDFAGLQSRRPRHDSHADDSGVADHHAGVRAARRDSFRRVWRIQRGSLRLARRRFRQPRTHLR